MNKTQKQTGTFEHHVHTAVVVGTWTQLQLLAWQHHYRGETSHSWRAAEVADQRPSTTCDEVMQAGVTQINALTRRKNTVFGTCDAHSEAALTILLSLRRGYTPQYESTLSSFVELRDTAESSVALWQTGFDCWFARSTWGQPSLLQPETSYRRAGLAA